MDSNTHQDERLKLHEAVGVTALVAFVAISVTVTFTFLAARCYVVDTIVHFKKKGDNHVY